MKLSELAATKWTGNDVKIATAVALAESRGKMGATNKNSNGTFDDGPWQVNSVHGYDREQLRTNPEYTVNAAHNVWSKQGWPAWTTYKTGAYLAFMGQDADLSADDPSLAERIAKGLPFGLAGVGASVAGADLPNPVGGIDAIGSVIGSLANPSTWMRIGKGTFGGALLILGVGSIAFVVANKASSSPIVQTAAKAIP